MFDFSSFLNLPLIFNYIIAFAIFMYVFLDGFDLGVGILFPYAPTHQCRSKMMNSVVPFWDGNETWLVLGGGGLFAAFPLAFSIIMPAFYIPIIAMLLGLIFRGVAFEFRFKTESKKEQAIWDVSFHIGSVIATFSQGIMLGAFIQGIEVEDGIFVGNSFDCINSFSLMTGLALIFGYSLLGSTWLIMKTDRRTADWARRVAASLVALVAISIILVSCWTPFLNDRVYDKWFSGSNIFYLAPIPFAAFLTICFLVRSLIKKREKQPFILTILLFALCYLGLVISLFPFVVPYQISFEQGAAVSTSLSLLLVGISLILPIILCYTAYSYYVFRGKSSHGKMY